MNVAVFGGTFDPIHRGISWWRALLSSSYTLQQVLLVASGRPPHQDPGDPEQ
jgi:nicotinic acid mononucleotide adenylyltransferase